MDAEQSYDVQSDDAIIDIGLNVYAQKHFLDSNDYLPFLHHVSLVVWMGKIKSAGRRK